MTRRGDDREDEGIRVGKIVGGERGGRRARRLDYSCRVMSLCNYNSCFSFHSEVYYFYAFNHGDNKWIA